MLQRSSTYRRAIRFAVAKAIGWENVRSMIHNEAIDTLHRVALTHTLEFLIF